MEIKSFYPIVKKSTPCKKRKKTKRLNIITPDFSISRQKNDMPSREKVKGKQKD